MARYVDGFLLPVPTKKVAAYRKLAQLACKVWLEYGALQYFEGTGDDMAPMGTPVFAKAAGAKKNETVVFAWILYRSRAHRDRINAKVMKDPRLLALADKPMPFDMKRICTAGFTALVDGEPKRKKR